MGVSVKNKWQAIFPNGFAGAQAVESDNLKTAGKTALSAVGPAVSATQTATGNATVLALATAGAAASATGIGLVVTSAAATLTLSTLAAVSAHKSEKHADRLHKIYKMHKCYKCLPVNDESVEENKHALVLFVLKHYLIEQKEEKQFRKMAQASIILSPFETAYTLGRSAYKRLTGSRGVDRKKMAGHLAEHLITHNCGLVQAIVSDLYSYEQMGWLLTQDYEVVVECLANKMKSR